jgi:flagellar protein FlaG
MATNVSEIRIALPSFPTSAAVPPVGPDIRTPVVEGAGLPAAADVEKATPSGFAAAAQALNVYVDQRRSDLRFRIDEGSGRVVVSVVDSRTGEVLRQIPGEAALKIAQQIVANGGGSPPDRA